MANVGTVGLFFQVQNLGSAVGAISQFRRHINFLGTSQRQLSTSSALAGTGLGGLEKRFRGVSTAASALGKAISLPSRLLVTFGSVIRKIGFDLKNLGNEIAAVGFRLGFLVTLPVFSFFGAAARGAINYEKQLVQMINLTDASIESVTAWKDELLDLSVALGTTPSELVRGLFAITSAGFTGAGAMDILTQSAKLAAVGLGDIAVIGRAVTGVILGYGLEAEEAARVTDTLIAIIDQGNVEIDQLADEFGRVVGLASEVGVSFEHLGAFIATFTQSGISADEAVTSVRQVLALILKPSRGAQEAIQKLGFTFEEFRHVIEDVGLTPALIELRKRGDEVGVSMADIFPNVRALAGELFVTGGAAEEFVDNFQKIAGASGATERAFERVQLTTAFAVEQFKAGAEALAITLGSVLLPAINEILGHLLNFAATLRVVADEHPRLILIGSALALIVAAVAPLLVITGLLISSIGTLIGTFGGFIALLGAALSPIGLVITGFIALVATISGLFLVSLPKIMKQTETTFTDLAKRAFAWGKNIIVSLAHGMASAIGAVVRVLISIGRTIAYWLSAQSPPRLLPDLETWGAAAMDAYLHGFTLADFSIFNDLSGTIERLFRSLSTDIIPEDQLIPMIIAMRDAVAQAITEMRELGHITEATADAIDGWLGQANPDIANYVNLLFDVEAATAAVEAAQDAMAAATERVADAQERLNRITEKYDRILRPIQQRLNDISDIRDAFIAARRIQELQAIITNPEAPDEAVFLAQLELEEIGLEQQLDALQERQAEEELVAQQAIDRAEQQLDAYQDQVDIAEENLAMIQEQLDLQLEIINAQIETNELWREQERILESLIDRMSRLPTGPEGEDLFEGGAFDVEPFDPESLGLEPLDKILKDAEENFKQFKQDINGIITEITAAFFPLKTLFDELGTTWAPIFITVAGAIGQLKDKLPTLQELKDILGGPGGLIELLLGALTGDNFLADLGAVTQPLGPKILNPLEFMEGFEGGGPSLPPALLEFIDKTGTLVPTLLTIATVVGDLGRAFKTTLGDGLDRINQAWDELGDSLDELGIDLPSIKSILIGIPFALIAFGLSVISGLFNAIGTAIEFARPFVVLFFERLALGAQAIQEFLQGPKDLLSVLDLIIGLFVNSFLMAVDIIGAAVGFVIGLIVGLVEGIINFFKNLFNELVGNSIIPDLVAKIIEFFKNLVTTIVNNVAEFVRNIISKAIELKTRFVARIVELVTSVTEKIVAFKDDFIAKVVEFVNSIVGPDGHIAGFVKGFIGFFENLFADLLGPEGVIPTFIKNAVEAFLQGGKDFITAIADGIVAVASTIYNALSGVILGAINNVLDALPGPIADALRDFFNIPEFQAGGLVPGVGPQLAVVHGGEIVLPRHVVDAISRPAPIINAPDRSGTVGGVQVIYGNVTLVSPMDLAMLEAATRRSIEGALT